MNRLKIFFVLVLIAQLLIMCRNNNKAAGRHGISENVNYRIIGYVAGYRDFDFSAIDASKLTHINYAFSNVIDGKVMFDTSGIDETSLSSDDLITLGRLRQKNPDLKILVSVGGWTWSGNFSDAALTEDSRSRFAVSAAGFVERYNLDGIDIDWEYPNQTGAGNIYRAEDRENFTLLLRAVRERLDEMADEQGRSEGYLLTIATGADIEYIFNTDLGKAHKYLDFINIMTYDFHNGLHTQTGHHANLQRSSADDPGGSNILQSVQLHLDAGVPASKLNMGIPFYGRMWEDVYPEKRGLYQEAATTGQIIFYRTIAEEMLANEGFVRYWDVSAAAPYLWNEKDSIFVSYEDEESIRQKMDWLRRKGLGGVMFWEYTDDPSGRLLDAVWHYLRETELVY